MTKTMHLPSLIKSFWPSRRRKLNVAEKIKPNTEKNKAFVVLRDDAHKYKFVCHSAKERRRAKRLFVKEEGTIEWLSQELRPDDVFFDIGANIGVYTVYAAKRMTGRGQVVAFEPHIPNAASLVENIILNGLQKKVCFISCALTNASHFDNFNYKSVAVASSSSQFAGYSHEGNSFEPALVEIKYGCTIDSLFGHDAIPKPNIIKMDVDGHEFHILEGMSGLLRSSERPRSIQVELGSRTKSEITKLLSEIGYDLRKKHWTQSGLKLITGGVDPESIPHNAIFSDPGQA